MKRHRNLGSSPDIHTKAAAMHAKLAESFYNTASVDALAGKCASAITMLTTAARHEGQVDAHTNRSKDQVKKLYQIHDRTITTVIKKCFWLVK